MDIKEQIHGLTEEMLTNLGRLVAIDSQLGTPAEGKPFGEGPAKALEEGLKIAQELGFKTVNLDNYCGYAEMGEGDEIVGIAGHLDIVPVGGDWSYDPFKLTREGDYVYGRGTTDDKGPVLEALYASETLSFLLYIHRIPATHTDEDPPVFFQSHSRRDTPWMPSHIFQAIHPEV